MERMMQYIWQHRLWDNNEMSTVDGRRIEVIDPGRINRDAGPDFFNAKVRIDGQMWVGDIEIHVRASDWYRHGHQTDKAYGSVILHVVQMDDIEVSNPVSGDAISQMILRCSENLMSKYRRLTGNTAGELRCRDSISGVPGIAMTDWITSLAFERLQAKSERILELLGMTVNSWEEVGYITLARALGSGTNGEAFQRLALSMPLKFLGKHADSISTVESMLFGQAGMLEEEMPDNRYYSGLKKEYRFMCAKFGLQRPVGLNWKMARMRPSNFPHRKIALLAAFVAGGFRLTRNLIEAEDVDTALKHLTVPYSTYWQTHYNFSPIESDKHSGIGKSTLESLVINVAVPLIYAFGLSHPGISEGDRYQDKAVRFLEQLDPERNFIVTLFGEAGIRCKDAFTSQALIQLRREYCEKRKCIYCRIGHRMLAYSNTDTV